MMNTYTDLSPHLALRPVSHTANRLSLIRPALCRGLADTPSRLADLLPALDKTKQAALQKAVAMIVEAAQAGRSAQHGSQAMMILLFGGYARGDWVEKQLAGANQYAYQSHVDLLVIVKKNTTAKQLKRKKSLHSRLREVNPPIHMLVEVLYPLTLSLAKGQGFFTQIMADSLILYDTGGFRLTPPEKACTLASGRCLVERKTLAQRNFDHWFAKADTYQEYAQIAINRGDTNEAAFFLHQSVESYYHTLLLTLVRYTPNTHNLRSLSLLAASLEPHLVKVFPQGLEEERNAFELLCQAYVSARYRPNFHISQAQLSWLFARVDALQTRVKQYGQQHIAGYG